MTQGRFVDTGEEALDEGRVVELLENGAVEEGLVGTVPRVLVEIVALDGTLGDTGEVGDIAGPLVGVVVLDGTLDDTGEVGDVTGLLV